MNHVKIALLNLHLQSKDYNLTKHDDIMSLITFDTTEFLSAGVFIDINYNFLNDTTSELIIEVRRKVGSFNQGVEIQKANQHIQNMLNLVSANLKLTVEEIDNKLLEIEKNKKIKDADFKNKVEENKQKEIDFKANSPVKYYLRNAGMILITLILLSFSIWGITKLI